jgi:acyl-CoA reductase-like NAD-dependent aldehyde dehydrogenase
MNTSILRVINPFTEKVEWELPLLSEADIEPLVIRARNAFQDWRRTPMEERIALCTRFADAFETMRETIAEQITRQMGKPLQQARNEVNTMLDRARQMTAIAKDVLADEYLPEKQGFVRFIRHEPLGVVLDIAAWNYPLLIAVNVVVPAVLAGNAVILKHSSRTPLCGQAFVDAFAAAGAPEFLVQAVIADHRVTAALIQHPHVNAVSFTGSVQGGYEVSRAASQKFIPLTLELGGKDPAYVCADADFDFAVENTMDGAFYNAGQSCCAVERIYVERSIYSRFLEAFVEKTRGYVLGDPMEPTTTMGPLASRHALDVLTEQVKDALVRGGKLLLGPQDFAKPSRGWFFPPTVVADAPQDSTLMQEESFGPVIGILPVANDEEAVRLMNDSRYGLTASIWTSDMERAIRIGAQIDTGTFYMNRCDYLDPLLPWTGVKESGRGVSLSKYGLLALTRLKSMHLRVEIPR